MVETMLNFRGGDCVVFQQQMETIVNVPSLAVAYVIVLVKRNAVEIEEIQVEEEHVTVVVYSVVDQLAENY